VKKSARAAWTKGVGMSENAHFFFLAGSVHAAMSRSGNPGEQSA